MIKIRIDKSDKNPKLYWKSIKTKTRRTMVADSMPYIARVVEITKTEESEYHAIFAINNQEISKDTEQLYPRVEMEDF